MATVNPVVVCRQCFVMLTDLSLAVGHAGTCGSDQGFDVVVRSIELYHGQEFAEDNGGGGHYIVLDRSKVDVGKVQYDGDTYSACVGHQGPCERRIKWSVLDYEGCLWNMCSMVNSLSPFFNEDGYSMVEVDAGMTGEMKLQRWAQGWGSAVLPLKPETAWSRQEHEPCQAGTAGCSVDHVPGTDSSCETW